jgi:hypothetical protein
VYKDKTTNKSTQIRTQPSPSGRLEGVDTPLVLRKVEHSNLGRAQAKARDEVG